MDDQINEKECWNLIDLYHKQPNVLVKHLIDSYNHFINEDFLSILTSRENIFQVDEFLDEASNQMYLVKNKLEFYDLLISHPTTETKHGISKIVFPNECRKRNLTYSAKLWCNVRQVQEIINFNNLNDVKRVIVYDTVNQVTNEKKPIPIGKVPIMVGSEFCNTKIFKDKKNNECKYDPGGYFIINGGERVVVPHETIADKLLIMTKKDGTNLIYNAEIRMTNVTNNSYGRSLSIKYKKNSLYVILNQFKNRHKELEIPIFIMFRALGVETDKDIINIILGSSIEDNLEMFNLLQYSKDEVVIKDDNGEEITIYTKKQALTYLSKYMSRTVRYSQKSDPVEQENRKINILENEVLNTDFLPKMKGSIQEKAYYLGYIINKLLKTVLEIIPPSDRDSYENKRIETPGVLLGQILKQSLRKMIQECTRIFKVKIDSKDKNPYSTFNIIPFIKPNTVEKGFKDALATGFWGLQSGKNRGRKGVSQVLKRLSSLDSNGHLRRVVSPSTDTTTNKLVPPRRIHPTHWGFICPAETPEGHKVGMVKNLAMLTEISRELKSQYYIIKDILNTELFNYETKENNQVLLYHNNELINKINTNSNLILFDKMLSNFNIYIHLVITLTDTKLTIKTENKGISNKVNEIINNKNNNKYLIPILNIEYSNINYYAKVFINYELIGFTILPFELESFLKEKRSNLYIDKSVSISYNINEKEVNINCDGGRPIKPFLVVKDNKILVTKKIMSEIKSKNIKTWHSLIQKYPKCIEYLDVNELLYSTVAAQFSDLYKNKINKELKIDDKIIKNDVNKYGNYVYNNYTHCLFHPSVLLGYTSNVIPFSNHNQSPRNCYSCAQSKQAMGIYTTNYLERIDKLGHILYYPQKSLVTTRNSKYIFSNVLPTGQNAIVAIACYTGYNQEDSIIFNKAAIDRGLFVSVNYRKEQDTLQKNPNTSEMDQFIVPDSNLVSSIKSANYDKLDNDGFISEETAVVSDDVIIGKITSKVRQSDNDKYYKDVSTIIRNNQGGIIDSVFKNMKNQENNTMTKIRIRKERRPIIGDKFSSRHGQKGVIGIIYNQEDMPFTEEGITPDIIINPHCIPSRMTVAQLIECIMGKVSAIEGTETDGTPFEEPNIDLVKKKLKSYGYDETGNEDMYCGFTGKKFQTKIFIGPTYYQRLRHLVEEKVHSRAKGPIQIMTRQPVEGRARDGGLRIGEMERDSIAAHGCTGFLKDKLMDSSDPYTVHICNGCGNFAVKIKGKNTYECKSCEKSNISKINLPYATKLFIQEMRGLTISSKIITNKSEFI